MKGICALFDEDTELRESHIFPKFVINHTKRTGSKFLRNFSNPNVRIEDGIKSYLLGHNAEQEFSKREKWFAENIFNPYLNGNRLIPYNENLYYFIVSFLWRILIFHIRKGNLNNNWYYDILLKAESQWKSFLSKDVYPYDFDEIYMLFTDRINENNTDLKDADYYFTRAMDATIVSNKNETGLAVYGKFNRFIFFGILKYSHMPIKVEELKINPLSGIIKIPQIYEHPFISSFLYNRIKGLENLPLPNEKQQQKIYEEILKNPDDFWNSDAGKSLYNDKFNLNKDKTENNT